MKKLSCTLIVSLFLFSSCSKKTEETKPVVKNIQETVFASGILQAEGTYKLTAQTSGYISEIYFKEGDLVLEGSLLAEIDNPDNSINAKGASQLLDIAIQNANSSAPLLQQAKSNISLTKEQMELDQKLKNSYQRLWESNSIAKIDYDNAVLKYNSSKSNYEVALKNYEKLKSDAKQQVVSNKTTSSIYQEAKNKQKLKAVKGGKVYKKYKHIGDFVRQGDVIAEIGNPTEIYALVNIDESNIYKINLNQKAIIQLNTNKSSNYEGSIREILPAFDDKSQSFLCKIYFNDSLDFSIINTQLQANIIVGNIKNALLIPRNYIDFGGYVQIKGEEQKTKVQTNFISSDWVHVLSGINENTVLVTEIINTK